MYVCIYVYICMYVCMYIYIYVCKVYSNTLITYHVSSISYQIDYPPTQFFLFNYLAGTNGKIFLTRAKYFSKFSKVMFLLRDSLCNFVFA